MKALIRLETITHNMGIESIFTQEQVEKFKRLEGKKIPAWIDYDEIKALKTEAKRRLAHVKPVSLGQASRIAGVTPADISLLMVWIERGQKARN